MKRERGQALLLVLALLGVGAVLIVPFLQIAATASQTRQEFSNTINEDYAADAAIEYGMWRLQYETGFVQSLPMGQESAPFYIFINGVQASTTVTAKADVNQPNGQTLASFASSHSGRQANPYKVTKTVSASSTYATFASDGFESHSSGGGSGNWTGSWTLTGTNDFNTTSSYEGTYHLRLRGGTPQGYAKRQVNLSQTTGAGPYLNYWARIESFESGDYAYIKVSIDGTNWNTLETFDYTDSNNQWRLYQYDLSGYGRPAVFFVAFQANMSSTYDYFHIDFVSFTGSQAAQTIQPGVLTEYTYLISIECMDPNGGTPLNNEDLRRIIDDLPDRNATSGDYMQYINGSTSWDAVDWGYPAFNPTTVSYVGSGTTYHQRIEWNFRTAGYSDISFAYGQVRTLSFRARAALNTGVYANTISIALSSYSLPVIISAAQAPFIVGTPAVTSVPGSLLSITKTANPLIIYAKQDTTVTYTVNIKNEDTVAIPIYEIQDWLPSTGSTDRNEGFIYVPNSAYGMIFNSSNVTTPQLFYDGFNGSNTYTVPNWIDSDGGSSGVRVDSQSACLTIPAYQGNQYMLTATGSIGSMTSSSYRSAMRFTAQTSQSIKYIRVYVDTKVGTSPTYRFGLRSDYYGDPSTSWLGGSSNYGNLAPSGTGWQTVTLPAVVSLTAGTTYHVVGIYGSGTINGSNYISLRRTTPQNFILPYNGEADSESDTEWYDGASWTQQGYQPLYLLETAASAYEGNPCETSTGQSIYGANYAGEKHTISGGDQTISTVGFYVKKNNSNTPLDDLYYQIRDNTNAVLRSGTLVAKASITTSFAWYDVILASPLTLTNGSFYTLNLYSTNTNSSNYYQVMRVENTNAAAYNSINFNGTYSVYTASANSGSSWTDSQQYDILFRTTPVISITRSGISTTGYTGIVFSYDYWRGGSTGSNPQLRVEWKPSANTTWNILNTYTLSSSTSQHASWNLPAGAEGTTIDIRFTNITCSAREARVDNVKVISTPLVPFTPVGMPDTDSNASGHHFFDNPDGYGDWHGDSYWLRWELDWTFQAGPNYWDGQGNYPAQDDPIWDNGNICGQYPWHDYETAGLVLQPGETFRLIFQAQVNLEYSGSYYNEVFVRIPDQGSDQEWLYSWPTGAISVPEYDLQATTLNDILRANAMITPEGHWWRSWHWWRRR